jgi:hypothetical protein
MFYTFSKQKIALMGVALLIVAAGVFFWFESGSFNPEGVAVGAPFGSSSTLSASSGQEIDVRPAPIRWPSLLIEGEGGTSEDLQTALDKEMAKAGLSSAPRWCDFSSEDRATPRAVLSEIAWMGSSQDPNDEWIELSGIGGQNSDTKGWQLMNRSGRIKIDLGTVASSSWGDFLVLKRVSGDYSGALNNSGDWLKVFNVDCRVVDELNASNGWPAGDNVAKKTLERDADSSSWHTSADVGGSPGAKNSEVTLAVPTSTPISSSATTSPASSVSQDQSVVTSTIISSPTSTNATSSTSTTNVIPAISTPTSTTSYPLAHVVIYSLQTTGGEGATDEDYIKIFNPSVGSADVSGWKLRKRTQSGTESSIKVFPEGSVIAPGGYFTWANSANGFASNTGANVSSTQILSSDNSVALFDVGGILIDAVAWGSGHATPYIEGSAYPENPGTSQKLARKLEGGNARDTGNNAEDFQLN